MEKRRNKSRAAGGHRDAALRGLPGAGARCPVLGVMWEAERCPRCRPYLYLSSWRRGGSHRTDGARRGVAAYSRAMPGAGRRRAAAHTRPAAAAAPAARRGSSAAGGTAISPPAPSGPARPRRAAARPRLPPSAPGRRGRGRGRAEPEAGLCWALGGLAALPPVILVSPGVT